MNDSILHSTKRVFNPSRYLAFTLICLLTLPVSGFTTWHDDDIVEVAEAAGMFSTLLAAVEAADLLDVLKGDGPFTVFAPSDDAFDLLGSSTIESLLEPENRDRLRAILSYHVVSGRIGSEDLLANASAKTVNGKALPIGLSIGGATIIATDIEAENGIIHVIDRVLIPREKASSRDRKMADRKANAKTVDLIELAINKGAPLYNRGQIEACASVYQLTAQALLDLNDDLSSRSKRILKKGLRDARNNHSDDDQAWILREALDDVLKEMAPRRKMTSRNKH